ncbi:aminopeptidase [Deinococcus yavapaiensis]|uniref:Aminopeptidase T n=1 Tax=Deinococcus yavapaiensis KR-236 TaxID=694435 RepID=A0A318S8V1_9DEIO|nr:aminopeptidase [Deinococcus yavapaiensis]PYE54545.1 aminopeptidase T [Deinococcus yavapaiensis KR-236]
MPTFQENLERYADLLVRVGVNLQPGGKLQLNAPIDAADLARLIAKKAYEAGALVVDVRYSDPLLARATYEAASDAALDYFPAWGAEESLHKIEEGYAYLSLTGSDPDVLAGVDPTRIARSSKAYGLGMKRVADLMSASAVNWSVAGIATPGWARKVFPDLEVDEAVAKLWEAIFTVSRADVDDPVTAWREHTATLRRVVDHLNERRYDALHFTGTDTDLTVGLADNHIWAGGSEVAQTGIEAVPNIPTDEAFTAPHRDRVNGHVRATKPLSVRGTLVEDIRVRFENGRVVEATASRGQDTFVQLLDTDEGARHLGEIALVAASAPVARTGVLFYNTLFDENAASHIALGRAYSINVEGGLDAMAASGANDSLIHVDWMIGSADMNVDGIREDGTTEPVMRAGEWAF